MNDSDPTISSDRRPDPKGNAEFECECCGGKFPAEDRLLLGNRAVCDVCSDQFLLCVDCNAWVPVADLDDEQCCESCRTAALPIRAYGYKPEAIFYGNDSVLFLGLELELNVEDTNCNLAALADRLLQMLPYAYAKQDRSIPRGFELVTHPATLGYHRSAWINIADVWTDVQDKHRFCCPDKTGMHVHLSKAFFSALQLARLLHFVNHENNLQFLTYIAQRPLRHWARREKSRHRGGGIKSALAGQHDRFRALNCNPADTVELRLFNGSSKVDDILKNLEFAHALAHWIKQADNRQSGDYRYFIDWLQQQGSKFEEFGHLLAFCADFQQSDGIGICFE